MDLDFNEVHKLFYIIVSSAENYSNNFQHWSQIKENTNQFHIANIASEFTFHLGHYEFGFRILHWQRLAKCFFFKECKNMKLWKKDNIIAILSKFVELTDAMCHLLMWLLQVHFVDKIVY